MQFRQLLLAVVCIITCATGLHAQQLWLSAEGRVNINKALRADVEVEHRSQDQFEATSRWSAGVGLSYKTLSWLRLGVSYKFVYDRDGDKITKKGNFLPAYWQPGHRVQISATGSHKFGKFDFSLREAYQYTRYPEQYVDKFDGFGNAKDDEWIEPENRHMLRSRLEVEYKHKKKALVTPYASVELYNNLSDGFSVRKLRYTAGADFRINKRNSVAVFYRFVDHHTSDNYNVIGASYQFKFK